VVAYLGKPWEQPDLNTGVVAYLDKPWEQPDLNTDVSSLR
jgi:hypothetical protein